MACKRCSNAQRVRSVLMATGDSLRCRVERSAHLGIVCISRAATAAAAADAAVVVSLETSARRRSLDAAEV